MCNLNYPRDGTVLGKSVTAIINVINVDKPPVPKVVKIIPISWAQQHWLGITLFFVFGGMLLFSLSIAYFNRNLETKGGQDEYDSDEHSDDEWEEIIVETAEEKRKKVEDRLAEEEANIARLREEARAKAMLRFSIEQNVILRKETNDSDAEEEEEDEDEVIDFSTAELTCIFCNVELAVNNAVTKQICVECFEEAEVRRMQAQASGEIEQQEKGSGEIRK